MNLSLSLFLFLFLIQKAVTISHVKTIRHVRSRQLGFISKTLV